MSLRNRTAIVALVLFLTSTAVFAVGPDSIAATVNGEAIPISEVEAVLAARPAELFPIPEVRQRLNRREVLESLISERLMNQFLDRNAVSVEPAEVARQMDTFVETLKGRGKSLADFCKESRQSEAQVRSGMTNLLRFAAYARKQATDAELRRYFNENIDFFRKTTVRLSHIVIRIPDQANREEREQARQRLVELRRKIASGTISFADAARQNSQCPSAPSGGDIGIVARKWVVDEAVARTAFAMKPGEVSDVVESQFGLHLLKVTERNDGKPVEFSDVIEDVRDNYVEELRQKTLTELRRTAHVQIMLP